MELQKKNAYKSNNLQIYTHMNLQMLGYIKVVAILCEVAYLKIIVPKWFENYSVNGEKLDLALVILYFWA